MRLRPVHEAAACRRRLPPPSRAPSPGQSGAGRGPSARAPRTDRPGPLAIAVLGTGRYRRSGGRPALEGAGVALQTGQSTPGSFRDTGSCVRTLRRGGAAVELGIFGCLLSRRSSRRLPAGRGRGRRLIELLKAYLSIKERDDEQEIRERVAAKLQTLDRTLEPLLTPPPGAARHSREKERPPTRSFCAIGRPNARLPPT